MRTRSDDAAVRRMVRAMGQLPPPLAGIVADYDEDTDYMLWRAINRDWPYQDWGRTASVIASSGIPGWLIARRYDGLGDAVIVTYSPRWVAACETDDDVWDFMATGLHTPAMRSLFCLPAFGPSAEEARAIKALHTSALDIFAEVQRKLKAAGHGTHHTA